MANQVKIWSKANTFDTERNLALAWMCTITRNTAIDELRARKTSMSILTDEMLIIENMLSNELRPDVLISHYDAVKNHLNSIKNLRSVRIQCLIFFNYYGYSHGELSERFDIPLGTVKSWVRRSPLINRPSQNNLS